MKTIQKGLSYVFVVAFAAMMFLLLGTKVSALNETTAPVQLPSEISSPEKMYVSDKNKGIYYLSGRNINFYSLETGKISTIVSEPEKYCDDFYFANNKLYSLHSKFGQNSEGVYTCFYTVKVYDIATKKVTSTFDVDKYSRCYSIGADGKGRIYISGNDADDNCYLGLFNSAGKNLSYTKTDPIYSYIGFNDKTGMFYIKSYYNWIYWGFEHDMDVVRAAKVTSDNKVEYSPMIIDTVCQKYWYDRACQVTMDGNYLFLDSTFYNQLEVFDVSDYTVGGEEIDLLFSKPRVNTDSEGEFDHDMAYGPRAIYRNESKSVIAYSEGKYLTEYDKKGNIKANYKTKYTPYALFKYDGKLLVMEKNGEALYYEYFDWKESTTIDLTVPKKTMTAGSTMQLTATTDGKLENKFTWTSSNPRVLSVDERGKVTAMAKGKATITVSTSNGLKKSTVITVDKEVSTKTPSNYSYKLQNGIESNNILRNTYAIWSSPVDSYMYEYSGKLYRVENIGKYTAIEQIDLSAKKVVSTKKINHELPIFGGFYSGTKYNFLVYGNSNKNESDDVEVIRIVKYDKAWKRIGAVSVKGANTYRPFDFGSLRMEQQGDFLYIHTCHTMYDDGDGLNHQANMTFKLNIGTMKIVDKFYDVLNISQAGYVSHSFNQFVKTDKDYVYRVDHGDSYPRAVSITKASLSGKITSVSYSLPVDMYEINGENATGVSVGGFELSDENCIIVGNIVNTENTPKDEYTSPYKNRNIFVSITDKKFEKTKLFKLTKFDDNSKYTTGTPQMVKFGYDNFLVIWEVYEFDEYDYISDYQYTEMVTINGRGELTSDIKYTNARLSECNPIYCSDGYIKWYYTQDSKPCVYKICPFDLSMKNPYIPTKVSGFKCYGKTASEISLKWNKNNTATGYIIEQYKDGKWVTVKKITDNNITSFKLNGLSAFTRHAFRIQAYKKFGSDSIKGEYSDKLVVYTNPKSVSGFKLKARTYNSVTLTWTKNTSATGYILEQYKGNKWVRIAKLTSNATTSYKVTGLSASTRYAFRIRAYKNITGGALKSSYTNKLVTYTTPKSMSGFKCGGKTDSVIRLNWNKNATATGYIVEQYKDGKWVRIAKIKNNATTTYRVTGLSASTRYAFRIQAYKEFGTGALKGAYTKKLVIYTKPRAVTGFGAMVKSKDFVVLSWNKNTSATGYIIEQYKGGKWVRIAKLTSNTSTTYKVTGLKANTRYAFRIQAYKNIPNSAVRSEFTDKLVVYTAK